MTNTQPELRKKQITRVSAVGILANVLLSAAKAVIGWISGSIAVILDAVNNLTDALSSVITIIGIKLAHRAPDEKHPYGHGRSEYFSAILIAGIVLFAGGSSLVESIKKIIVPEDADYSNPVTLGIIALAIVVKLILGFYVKKKGNTLNSDALKASGADAMFDAVISASTLVAAAVSLIFHVNIDGYIGALIALFIIKAGIEMLLHPISAVMGKRPESEITKAIRKAVASVDGVEGAYDLVLHDYGPESAIGAVHIAINADLSAREIQRICQKVQRLVLEQFHVFLTVGIYAHDRNREEDFHAIETMAKAHGGVISMHGLFLDEEMQLISFDVLTDFSIRDKGAFIESLKEEVSEKYPGYEININIDTNYCD